MDADTIGLVVTIITILVVIIGGEFQQCRPTSVNQWAPGSSAGSL